jgi:hypothetical protein
MKKRNPQFTLPLGMFISNIGNGMYILAIGIILYNATGKTSTFAFMVVLQAILSFLTQSFASVISDKGFAKIAASSAEFLRGVIIIFCSLGSIFINTNFLVVAAALLSLLQPFYRTSIFVIGPLIAQDTELANYNARVSAFQQAGQLIGAGMAGLIISFFSPYAATFINGVSYLISSYTMTISDISSQQEGLTRFIRSLKFMGITVILKDWYDLIKHLMGNLSILFLALLGITDIVIASYLNIAYAPLLKHLQVGTFWISIWDSLFAVGAILGVTLFGKLKRFHKNIQLSIIGLTMECVLFLGFSFASPQGIACLMFLIGVFNSISISSFSLSLQINAKQKFLGKISGVRQLCISLATLLVVPILSRALNQSVQKGSYYVSIFIAIVVVLSFGVLRKYIFWKNIS